MKRGCPDHPKTHSLARMLGIPRAHAVGLLEMLWHWTSKYAIQGDIGKWPDETIASGAGWEDSGTIPEFIRALLESGWIDQDDNHRLLIHDWEDHADESVRKTIKNRKLQFFEKVSGKFEKRSAPAIAFPEPEPKPEPLRAADLSGITVGSRFEEFWRRYPHKVEKQIASQNWLSVVTTENISEVFAGLERWEHSEQWARGCYQKPGNWLVNPKNPLDRAWQDHPAPAKKRADDDAEVIAHMQELERQRQQWAAK